MALTMTRFEELALAEPGRWELHDGELVERPGMTMPHNEIALELAFLIRSQVDNTRYRLRSQAGHTDRTDRNSFVPDVMVIPVAYTARFRGSPRLERYADPLPFVAEVWSPSTGRYDVTAKLPEYRARGDEEIWFVHPIERTVHAWRRRPDGGYDEADYGDTGSAPIHSLGITVDLDQLFAFV